MFEPLKFYCIVSQRPLSTKDSCGDVSTVQRNACCITIYCCITLFSIKVRKFFNSFTAYSRTSMARTPLEPLNKFKTGVVGANVC